ncbi:MAG: hypothetical protein JW940_33405, partial [Polyangiaceae bacterium]|nr:hypothetical protein [Polyangiaceae bacterium]
MKRRALLPDLVNAFDDAVAAKAPFDERSEFIRALVAFEPLSLEQRLRLLRYSGSLTRVGVDGYGARLRYEGQWQLTTDVTREHAQCMDGSAYVSDPFRPTLEDPPDHDNVPAWLASKPTRHEYLVHFVFFPTERTASDVSSKGCDKIVSGQLDVTVGEVTGAAWSLRINFKRGADTTAEIEPLSPTVTSLPPTLDAVVTKRLGERRQLVLVVRASVASSGAVNLTFEPPANVSAFKPPLPPELPSE